MDKEIFKRVSNEVCLDFANTNDWHASDHPVENIHSYAELVGWGKTAGILPGEVADRLALLEGERPGFAERAYHTAIQIREAIFRIFSNRYAGQPVAEEDMAMLNSIVRQAMAHRELVPEGDDFNWKWVEDVDEENILLWTVTLSAANLLTSGKVSRVRVCEDDRGCGALFIDMSKNHSRRWCSMESCGNRAKAQRHYSRVKGEVDS
jgi:predicted RNA-binding Zn ribbon-like protein